MLDHLLSRKLIINLGKGGVGKSMVSALLAREAAARGKRVLVCEVNTNARMGRLLGGKPPTDLSDSMDHIWSVDPLISTVNIQPGPAMKEYVSQVLRLRFLYNIVFENRVMRYFLRAVPGLQELVYAGKIWYHVEEDMENKQPRFDLVIVDAPATGHGLALLQIAKVVIETVPMGPMYEAARKIHDLFCDPSRSCMNLVSLPEEMPTTETLELCQKLREDLSMPLGALFLNQWPRHPLDQDGVLHPLRQAVGEDTMSAITDGLSNDPKGWALQKVLCGGVGRVRQARAYLTRLAEGTRMPIITLPRLLKQSEAPESALVGELGEVLTQSEPLLPEQVQAHAGAAPHDL